MQTIRIIHSELTLLIGKLYIIMNILILSNADSCRSRIAQALLSSLGKGMKIYSAGTAPAAEVHPLVLKLIKETGIEPDTRPPHSIYEYTNKSWDAVIVLSGTTDEIRNHFSKEVKHWYYLPFDEQFPTIPADGTDLWEGLLRLKEEIGKKIYELYRDELKEQLLPRCTCGANDFCRCE